MPYHGPINQIAPNIYEIPMKHKSGMHVPGRIYANPELLEKMKTDLTLIQCVNVAHLPGIQKFAITLPDGHQGYGFPIGGVGATDVNEGGVVSPGGVGYDINCLCPSSKILTEHGYWVELDDLPTRIETEWIKLYNTIEEHNDSTRIVFVKERDIRKHEEAIKVTTESGRVIEGSEDHPVLTPDGYRLLRDLGKEDYIVVYPFDGIEYEKNDRLILTKTDFENYDIQTVNYLLKRNLIPLKMDDPRIGIIARLLGFALGDGSIVHEKGERERLKLEFYNQREVLKEIKKDLDKIGVTSSRIYSRKRIIKIKTGYDKEYESECEDNTIRIVSKSFALFLNKLGMPIGKKIEQKYDIPKWIKSAPLWIKRNFLAGLFGADGCKSLFKGYTPLPINLTQSKIRELEESLLEFLNEIRRILKEFGVRTTIYEVRSLAGKITYRLATTNEKSVKNFLEKINFEYSTEKKETGLISLEYLKRKAKTKTLRKKAIDKAKEIHRKTKSIEKAYNAVKGRYVNRRLIERAIYDDPKEVRIAQDFPEYTDFVKKYGLPGGFVLDNIVKIEKVKPEYSKFYDIGVHHEAHNFIANGVVVHNCGVRLLRTNLDKKDVEAKLDDLLSTLFRTVPSGVGAKGQRRFSKGELDEALLGGAKWAVEQGYGWSIDPDHCESQGSLEQANPDKISEKAKSRGQPQLGTLGSGNHFLELQYVDKIYDERVAKTFGITQEGQVTVMIHTGSRGFGHQVCSDYLRVMERAVRKYNIQIPDRELACAPGTSREGEDYIAAMSCAANFAWGNRQFITHWVREGFAKWFKMDPEELGLQLMYDVAHNICKQENHVIDGKTKSLFVHRKGATRAFPANHPDLPQDYKPVGQPVLLPGTMGTASYILCGQETGMEYSFGSTAHGAGRFMSRHKAIKRYRGNQVANDLRQRGIIVYAATNKGIAEEAPGAYKNIDLVAKVSHDVGIASFVCKLRPMGVVKG